MKIEILYEDKDILVINKPAGLAVHGDGRTKEKTLVDWILEKYPEMKNVGEPLILKAEGSKSETVIYRPGIVHRLDKETSGVLVLAKNQKTFEFLKEQFKERGVQKIYWAIVWGDVKKDTGIIDAPIARSKKDFRQWSAQKGKRGKEREAVTEYKVLKRFTSPQPSPYKGEGAEFTLLEVSPKTGRTHQIRVHMKYINYPIVCDKLYAPNNTCPILGLNRLALHSKSIEFVLISGKKIKIEAPLPSDIAKAMSL